MQELLIAFITIEITLLGIAALLAIMVIIARKNHRMIQELNKRIVEHNSDDDQESFNTAKAENWFEKGDLTALKQYCEHFIADSPNSVHANWYFALSHYNQGDYELAKSYFEQVIRINPLWREGAIVYLQEIANNLSSPKSQTLH